MRRRRRRKRRSTKAKEHKTFFQNPKVRLGVHSSAKKRAEGRQKKYLSIEIPTEETTAQICQETATGRRRKPKPKPRARAREREEKGRTRERERGETGRMMPAGYLLGASRADTEPQPPWGWSHLVDNRQSYL
jgi:hypothetical protein